MGDQEQAKEQYKRFMRGEKLTYTDRTKIVQYDQKATTFDKMDMRINALTELKVFEDLNTQEHIEKWEATQCDEAIINSLAEKEYYQLARNEKPENLIKNEAREEEVILEL